MSRPDLFIDLVPLDLKWCEPSQNLKSMRSEIDSRLKQNPQVPSNDRIFVFPELTLTGFVTKNPKDFSLGRDSKSVQEVQALAREFKTALIFGFPEANGPHAPLNTLIFIDPSGEIVADYQKMHLFTAGDPSEQSTYEAGTSAVVADYRGWKIGFGICFDLRFPKLFQSYAEAETDLVILPACWVGGPGKSHQFQTLSAAHAIAGQYYFASVNRAGRDPSFSFEGEALVYSPKGELLKSQAGSVRITEAGLIEARKLLIRVSDRDDYTVIQS